MDDSVQCDRHSCSLATITLPNIVFPKFDGLNPRLWVKHYETFFDVYDVDPHLWVSLASMPLVGSATLWLQTLQSTISKNELGYFCFSSLQ